MKTERFIPDCHSGYNFALNPDIALGNPLFKYQEYLGPGPCGIDACYARQFAGGDGSGTVRYIDVEAGWILDHESIRVQPLPFYGLNKNFAIEHGTAALGIIGMQENMGGGIGIVPRASGFVVSVFRPGDRFDVADAICQASAFLDFGDILILEIQSTYGSHYGKTWPVEIEDDVFDAIRFGIDKGVIVVEPAGNGDIEHPYGGGNDLDEYCDETGKFLLNRNKNGFRDSGAIIVAAAESGVPHRRLHFTNYGNRVDCFAWGENIVTAGNYPRSSGMAINLYTDKFGGCSGATAIIAGAAISIQSIYEGIYHSRLGPSSMRSILSNAKFGTESIGGHLVDKIGVMPDLKKIIDSIIKKEAGLDSVSPFQRT